MSGMGYRAQLRAKAPQRLGRHVRGKARRQFSPRRLFDQQHNVGGATAVKPHPHLVRGQRHVDALNASAITALAIGSLSTRTPLQSKMTIGPTGQVMTIVQDLRRDF